MRTSFYIIKGLCFFKMGRLELMFSGVQSLSHVFSHYLCSSDSSCYGSAKHHSMML